MLHAAGSSPPHAQQIEYAPILYATKGMTARCRCFRDHLLLADAAALLSCQQVESDLYKFVHRGRVAVVELILHSHVPEARGDLEGWIMVLPLSMLLVCLDQASDDS